ncbi:42676_t:CDS:2, partial [Gigaspora margarita]
LSALDMDEEIGSEEDEDDKEIDESTIKVLHNITDIYYEWDLLKRIVDALKPFEFATKLFSGSQYPTLSIMYSIIHKLQNQFIEFSLELSNNEDSDDEDNMLLDSENDDNTSPPPPDLNQIEMQFKIAISDSLNKYWHDFCEVGLAETKLRNEFENLHLNITSNDQPEQQTSTVIVTEIMQNPFLKEFAMKKADILIGWDKLA